MTDNPPRLSDGSLHRLDAAVARPRFDRSALRTGIVHLGLGAFARAHLAVYADDLLADGDLAWGIAGASLRRRDTFDALAPQAGLYTVLERGPVDRFRVVGALSTPVAPDGLGALLDGALLDDALAVISLTVTEKGYGRHAATGGLDDADPDIRADLDGAWPPRSAVGVIAAALRRRAERNRRPVAVMSCDNLANNGTTLGRLVEEYATAAWGHAEARRVADAATFPCAMVDRIVPATTDADRDAVARALGATDAWPVVTEPFTQWVIEDRFPPGRRPDWARAGATVVRDVGPHEAMKLRMLNGAHTALAAVGQVAGLATISDVIAEPAFAALAIALMTDAAETLPRDRSLDPAGYRDALLARFRNARLPHRTAQIANDTSRKLSPRILSVIAARQADGRSIRPHAFAVAAWLRLLDGTDENGAALAISDPAAAALRSDAGAPDPAEAVARVFGRADLFGDAAIAAPSRAAIAEALGRIRATGIRAAATTLSGAR